MEARSSARRPSWTASRRISARHTPIRIEIAVCSRPDVEGAEPPTRERRCTRCWEQIAFVLLIACTNVANLLLTRRSRAGVRSRSGPLSALDDRGSCANCLRRWCWVPGVTGWPGGRVRRDRFIPSFCAAGFRRKQIELICTFLRSRRPRQHYQGYRCLLPRAGRLEGGPDGGSERCGPGSAGRKQQRLRSLFVASEITLALILLVGAGLTVSSVYRLQTHETGFDPTNVTIAQLHISGLGT